MTTTEYAKRAGCSRRTVLRAIRAGLIPAKAVRWAGRGKHRTVDIVSPDLVAASWMPEARFPRICAAAPPQLEEIGIVGKAEVFDPQLRAEVGLYAYANALGYVAAAVMSIPELAAKRIDGLPVGAAEALSDLCQRALAGILPSKSLAKGVVAYIDDDAEHEVMEELLRTRPRGGERGRGDGVTLAFNDLLARARGQS